MMSAVTPRGFRDILPGEASWRESIREHVQECFESWGYMPIETPTLEALDVLTVGGGQSDENISLFDSDGKLLALRPDVTLPIARMIASRMSGDDGPFRLRYAQQVFRDQASLQAQEREFTQLGVEAIGLQGTYVDAEIIALFLDALHACNIQDFTIAICTVEILKSIIEESGMGDDWETAVLAAYHNSNYVALEELAAYEGLDERIGGMLLELPHIRGGREAILRCRELIAPLGCREGLDRLLETWDILEAGASTSHIVVDFSVMCSFDYYTGLAFEAYAPGFGLLLGSGGRYDHMLEAYGKSMPAAGFAFSLERVMLALRRQGNKVYPARPDALIGGRDYAAVFCAASVLRNKNLKVCITDATDMFAEAQRRGVRSAYIVGADGQPVLVGEEGDDDE